MYVFVITNPSLLGGIDEVDGDVDCLDEQPKGVNGDEEHRIGLDKRIVDPQHATEERNNVRHRVEPFRRFLPVNPIERRTAYNG